MQGSKIKWVTIQAASLAFSKSCSLAAGIQMGPWKYQTLWRRSRQRNTIWTKLWGRFRSHSFTFTGFKVSLNYLPGNLAGTVLRYSPIYYGAENISTSWFYKVAELCMNGRLRGAQKKKHVNWPSYSAAHQMIHMKFWVNISNRSTISKSQKRTYLYSSTAFLKGYDDLPKMIAQHFRTMSEEDRRRGFPVPFRPTIEVENVYILLKPI